MKLIFAVFVSAWALSAQDPQASPPVKKPVTKAAPKVAAKAAPNVTDASRPPSVPAEAVLGADGDYHYTDPQGKKWIYHRTPIGVSHFEDTPQLHSPEKMAVSFVKATEDGDKVRFERLGPFGLWKWEKKKSELDEFEKAALANSQAISKTASKQD